ncbi:rRNA maturation RNase YbeY [Candidatus Nomurabacteria bacterium]|nr:rRNA maturation RNase YbeY [Candidatus Nomurabacteria bacterium]
MNLTILNKTKSKLPRLPYLSVKNEVLGGKYELSLVFVGDTLSKKLNFKYRRKNKPTNVLSFPLNKTTGEIFINPNKAKKEAKFFGKSFNDFIAILFIHGLLHLKGMQHGSKMEGIEKKLAKKFNV